MIQLGISGCGSHGRHHARAAMQAGGFAVSMGYDADPAAVRRLAAEFPGMQPATTFEDLCRRSDAVVIASPDEHHYRQLLRALSPSTIPVATGLPMTPRPGPHILIDKPIAIDPLTAELALNRIEQERERGRVVTSCFPRRFDPPYMWVEDNLLPLEEQYGPLKEIHLSFAYGAPHAAWKSEGRSLLLDHFAHELDVLRFWLGDLPFTATPHVYDKFDSYGTTVHIALSKTRVVTANCSGVRSGTQRRFSETIILKFERGTVSIDTDSGVASARSDERGLVGFSDKLMTLHDDRLAGVMAAFADAINGSDDYLTMADLTVNTMAPAVMVLGETYSYQP